MLGGIEIEYQIGYAKPLADVRRHHHRLTAVELVPTITTAVKEAPQIAGQSPGYFIPHGRISLDGEYLEIATAEAITPKGVMSNLAGCEAVLAAAVDLSTDKLGLKKEFKPSLLRRSSDSQNNFRGWHVNLLSRQFHARDLVAHLIPYLATAFYNGGGVLTPDGFLVCDKWQAIETTSGQDTRKHRALVDLRNEYLSRKFRRIHLTAFDVLVSDASSLLSIGCAAIVVAMLDDGASIGPALELADPVDSLKRVNCDLSWNASLRLATGVEMSARDINLHYLKAAEIYAARVQEPWMNEIITLWKRVHLAFERRRWSELGQLIDPFIKLRCFAAHLMHHGMTLAEFNCWSPALRLVRGYPLNAKFSRDKLRASLRESMPAIGFELLAEFVDRNGLPWCQLPRIATLEKELQYLLLSYAKVENNSLYRQLCQSKIVETMLPQSSPAEPAPGTRAWARYLAMKDILREPHATASWASVNTQDRAMSLDDPFQTSGHWQPTRARGRWGE